VRPRPAATEASASMVQQPFCLDGTTIFLGTVTRIPNHAKSKVVVPSSRHLHSFASEPMGVNCLDFRDA
jgi:hypothetical protein